MNYYLKFDDCYVPVMEYFFKNLLDLYTSYFTVFKFNPNNEPFCESEMKSGDSIFYFISRDYDSISRSFILGFAVKQ